MRTESREPGILCEPRGRADPEDSLGGDGEAAENCCLRIVDIELRQAQLPHHGYQNRGVGEPGGFAVGLQEVEEEHGGGHSETYQVGEGVEFLTHRRVGFQQPGRQAVAEIEHGGRADADPDPLVSLQGTEPVEGMEGEGNRQDAAYKVAAGDGVGYGAGDYVHFVSEASGRSRPTWVMPPTVGSPILTKISVERGR